MDILLAIGPDPGDAPFPGRDSIGAPNEREQVRITCTPSTALPIRRAKDGEFHYLVGPDPSGRGDTPSEIAARLLGYHGQRRKCFPRSQVEAVWPDVVEAVLGAFDSAWENGTWPSLTAAQAELEVLEETDAAQADQTLQNSYWSLLTREDEPLDPFIPHDEDRLGWLTHEDRRTGITYSRPDRPARAIVEVLPGHSDAAESLQAFSERARFRDVIAVLGEPGKISASGRFWWRGTSTELNERLKSKRKSVWTYIQD